MEKIKIEQVDELYNFLQGICPEVIHVKHPPRLSQQKAFTVIWFLQEHLRILPDNFERCCDCGNLYDADREGGCHKDKLYCEPCYDGTGGCR